jgi:hypothetical protein
MRRLVRLTFLASVFLFIPDPANAAEEVSVPEILELGAELAGEEVTVEGELVGDYGFRDNGWMWTQLNGDAYVQRPIREGGQALGANVGIAVRVPVELTEALDPPGRYRNRGPVVRVTGVWKYHDSTRPGESYLQVQSLTVTEPGRQLNEEVNWTVVILGALLLVGAGVIALLTRPKDWQRPTFRC